MAPAEIVATGVAALLFAVTFLVGGRVHPFRTWIRDRRSIVSFGAGMSAAYVFVHVMPELHGARSAFVDSMSAPLRYEGMAIYLLSLVGFLSFYGLDHLRERLQGVGKAAEAGPAFKLHIGGFGVYVWLLAYLLLRNLEESPESILLYAVAIAFHLLAIDHSLRSEHGVAYERTGRYVLAGMAVLGWGMGLLFALPQPVPALLLAFISGAVIVNSAIMELPPEKDGRFVPFLVGGLVYGMILVPLT